MLGSVDVVITMPNVGHVFQRIIGFWRSEENNTLENVPHGKKKRE